MSSFSIKHFSPPVQRAIRCELTALAQRRHVFTSHSETPLPGIGLITRATLKMNNPHSIFIKNKLAKRLYYLVKYRRGISVPHDYWDCRWKLEEETYMMDNDYCTMAEDDFIDEKLYEDPNDIPYADLVEWIRSTIFQPTHSTAALIEKEIVNKAYDILTELYEQCYLDKKNFLIKQPVTAYHTLQGDSRIFAYYEIGIYKFHRPLDDQEGRKISPALITHLNDWKTNDTSKLNSAEIHNIDTFIIGDILGAPEFSCLDIDLDIGYDIKQEIESRRFIDLE